MLDKLMFDRAMLNKSGQYKPATRKFTYINVFAGIMLLLSGCVATTIGLVTVSTITLAQDPRTVGTFVDDNVIEASALKEMVSDPKLDGTHVSTTVVNGVALLTGEVDTTEQKLRAAAIANSFQGVIQVVNQLDLTSNSSLTSRSNDTLITAKVKTALIRDKVVESNNIKVVTERGVVYLMGIVTEQQEAQAVSLTQGVGGVERIVKVFMR